MFEIIVLLLFFSVLTIVFLAHFVTVFSLGTVFLPFEDNKDVKPEPVDIFGIKGTGVAISEEVDRWITKFIEGL